MTDYIRIIPAPAPMAKPARPDFILIGVGVLPSTKVGK